MYREDGTKTYTCADDAVATIRCKANNSAIASTTGPNINPFERWGKRIEEVYSFMRTPTHKPDEMDFDIYMNSSAYFVAKHYGIRLGDVWSMSLHEFEESFAFAAAAEKIKAEEMEAATSDSKGKMRVAGTEAGQPMPFSD